MMKFISASAVAIGIAFGAANAAPITETFDALGASATPVNSFAGGSVTTLSNGDFNQAVIFDTNDSVFTNDGDLEAPVIRKSTGVVEELNNILIISENAIGPGAIADDEAEGGVISFVFDERATVFSLDFVDTGEGDVTVSFYDTEVDIANGGIPMSGAIATFIVSLALDTGNNSPNFFDTFLFNGGIANVRTMVVNFGSNSGAIDNLVFEPVPVPAMAPLFVGALAAGGVLRRRAKAKA